MFRFEFLFCLMCCVGVCFVCFVLCVVCLAWFAYLVFVMCCCLWLFCCCCVVSGVVMCGCLFGVVCLRVWFYLPLFFVIMIRMCVLVVVVVL